MDEEIEGVGDKTILKKKKIQNVHKGYNFSPRE